jgi:hypothetical protein
MIPLPLVCDDGWTETDEERGVIRLSPCGEIALNPPRSVSAEELIERLDPVLEAKSRLSSDRIAAASCGTRRDHQQAHKSEREFEQVQAELLALFDAIDGFEPPRRDQDLTLEQLTAIFVAELRRRAAALPKNAKARINLPFLADMIDNTVRGMK